MMFGRNAERRSALADLRRFVYETSCSMTQVERKFRLFNLRKGACHEVVVCNTPLSPYTLTSVGVRDNEGSDRFATIQFYWTGTRMPAELLDRIVDAFDVLFPQRR